jgi:hypothetical protein
MHAYIHTYILTYTHAHIYIYIHILRGYHRGRSAGFILKDDATRGPWSNPWGPQEFQAQFEKVVGLPGTVVGDHKPTEVIQCIAT